ncbi:MAG: hypothetical protein DHS20C16_12050 [Phycisphaerae bacterium]|nr:MAG: hypothetical protein DHS20C16_12050 [Phycisphaerae bacterium]
MISVITLGIIGVATWQAWPQKERYFTDGQDLRVDANDAKIRDVLWREPQRLPSAINIDGDDYEPELDEADGAFYFVRGKTGDDANIFVSYRTNDVWSEPTPLDAINTEYDDLGPRLTLDGLTLYFYSDRPGGLGGYDLWVAHRTSRDETFGEPTNLGPNVNTSWDEYGPAPTPEGDRVYFSSNRRVGEIERNPKPRWSATLRENRRRTGYDLYVANVTGAGFGQAQPLESLNSIADDGTPAVSPNDDFVYFSSNRDGGSGGFDLYRARTGESGFGEIEWLGVSVNGPADELDPVLSMEGFELHFSSNRLAAAGSASPSEPTYDIYRTSSREVFVATEMLQAEFNWGAWLEILGPALLALLLLLLLLLLSRMLLSSAWRGRLSLIMRCLLASLFVHLLLLTLFMFWQVKTSLSGLFDRKGGVQVALASPANDAGLTAQIRGGFASTDVPTIQPASFERSFEHNVQPVRLAASHATMPRSMMPTPMDRSQAVDIRDAKPVHKPTTSQPALSSAQNWSQENTIALAIPKSSAKQPVATEQSQSLPLARSKLESQPTHPTAIPQPQPELLDASDSGVEVNRTELPGESEVLSDSLADQVVDARPALGAPSARLNVDVSIDESDFATPEVTTPLESEHGEATLEIRPVAVANESLRSPLNLGTPVAPQLDRSEGLAELNRPIVVGQVAQTDHPTALRDAELATSRHPTNQSFDFTPIHVGDFELTPPAIPTPVPATNAIGGQVTDAHTGDPIEGAIVRLDLGEVDAETAITNGDGAYALEIPQVPEHFAISASYEGYVPASVDISKEAVRKRSLTVNFRLRRVDLSTVALEPVPDVHHLGDDRFSGSVNSQFQKRSEGGSYIVEFDLNKLQVRPHMSRCELTMLTRGVQMKHPIYFNGQRTPLRIANSPRDGSFGVYRTEVDIRWLVEGKNTFGIKARSRGNDIDDFEFVNVQLRFLP